MQTREEGETESPRTDVCETPAADAETEAARALRLRKFQDYPIPDIESRLQQMVPLVSTPNVQIPGTPALPDPTDPSPTDSNRSYNNTGMHSTEAGEVRDSDSGKMNQDVLGRFPTPQIPGLNENSKSLNNSAYRPEKRRKF